MARIGGARPGAGRKRGSVSQRAVDVAAKAMSEGLTPIEYMLSIMRNEDADPKDRGWAAEKVAPYLHPRPAPVARPIQIDLPNTSNVEGINAAIDRVIQAVGQGEIAPGEGQSIIAVVEARRKAIETGDLLERIEKLERTSARPSTSR